MKRYWIEYQETQPECPMTFWVHRKIGDKPWFEAEGYDPPRQRAVPGKGFPVFKVEFDNFTFSFASLAEVRVCIDTLGRKLLPRTLDLSHERDTKVGPNSHWLSRLPAAVKPWKYRKAAVAYMRNVLATFEKEFT